MSQKFSESEFMRKKYIDKNKELEKKLKEQSDNMNELMDQLDKTKKETSSLRKAKSTNHKILEKKIAELEQCLQERNKTILDLRNEIKKLFENGKNQKSEFEAFGDQVGLSDLQVKAKPTLFGDFEDSED